MILIASIMLTIVVAILALTIFIPMPIDELGTEESKPSCREIEQNDELYFDSDMYEWVQQCRIDNNTTR
jgi:hypothetical protein